MATSLKKKIMDNLMITQAVKLSPRDKEILKDGIAVEKSILFSKVHIDKAGRKKAESARFNNLPFNDFMVLSNIEATDDQTGEVELDVDGMLTRMKRLNESTIRIFLYGGRSTKHHFTIITVVDLDIASGQWKKVAPKQDPEWFDDFMVNMMIGIKQTLWAITNFEPTGTIEPQITHAMKKKIPANQLHTYIEYTLDLTQAKRYPKSSHGGTHASPCEHVRRGHYRRLRNGKTIFVEAKVINPGSKRGKVEKDYQL